jgi:hypothetical protein
VLWATATAAGMGLLLGLRFRVNALIAASLALIALSSVAALFSRQPLLMTLALNYALLVALQGGYLVGLAMARGWSRFRRRSQT